MTKIIIFEDEPAALKRLKRMINEIRPTYEIVADADNVTDAIQLLKTEKFNLILSDIELSDGNCFEVFEKTVPTCPIVFITAYNNYAIKAFNYNGIHYLLKPLNYESLTQAFVKYENNTLQINQRLKESDFIEKDYQKRFISKIGNKLKIVETLHIMFFYTENGLVYAKTIEKQKYVLDETLEQIIIKLNPNLYFRINRQMIVNINAVVDMSSYTSNRLKLKLSISHHNEIVVSKDKSSSFKAWIASH